MPCVLWHIDVVTALYMQAHRSLIHQVAPEQPVDRAARGSFQCYHPTPTTVRIYTEALSDSSLCSSCHCQLYVRKHWLHLLVVFVTINSITSVTQKTGGNSDIVLTVDFCPGAHHLMSGGTKIPETKCSRGHYFILLSNGAIPMSIWELVCST